MTEAGPNSVCRRCGQELQTPSELPVCDSCALEDALRLMDSAVPLPAGPEPNPEEEFAPLGRLGPYELVKLLGRGGMGAVYKARHPGSDRWVAIKVLAGGVYSDQAARARLKREAQALAQLQHPGIVEVEEIGEAEGLPYLAMTLVDGPNLAELVADHPLEPGRAARLVAQAAEAIQSAHDRGILHRDLKPSNILLGPDDCPRVTDFGLALAGWMAQGVTRAGQTLGSPAYLAPEQITAQLGSAGPATDVYGLGAVLYHLLTGRPPFLAATATDTLEQVLRREVLAPRHLNPAIPFQLEAICLRCLEKRPERRYPTARALVQALHRFIDQPRSLAAGPWLRHQWRRARREYPLRTATSLVLLSAAIVSLVLAVLLVWDNRLLREQLVVNQRLAASERDLRAEEHRQRASLVYAQQIVAAQRAWEMGDVVTTRRSLRATDPTRRGWEHAYLEALLDRQHLRLSGHFGPVNALMFHPLGDQLASVGWDLTTRLWSLPQGRELHQWTPHDGRPLTVAFSPDGQSIASGAQDRRVRLWRGDPPQLERELRLDQGQVTTVAFHPSGGHLAVGDNRGFYHLWDLASGTVALVRQGDLEGLHSIAFSPDGQLLATGGADRSVRLWSFPQGERLRMLHTHRAPVRSVAFSPDGTMLASGSEDRTVRLWRVEDGALLRSLVGHQEAVYALHFAPDGSLVVSASGDRSLRLWDPRTGGLQRVLYGHSGRINTVAFSPDGQWLASGGLDTQVLLWRTDHAPLLRALDGHAGTAHRLAFSPDGRQLLSGSHDGTARLWDLNSGDGVQVASHGARVTAVAFSACGRWAVTGGTDGRCAVWDLAEGNELRVFAPNLGAVRALALAPDGKGAASSYEGRDVRIWSLATAEPLLEFQTEKARIIRLAFGHDGTRLYAAGVGSAEVEVYDAQTGERSKTLDLPGSRSTAMELCPRSHRMAVGQINGMVMVMDSDSGEVIWMAHGHSEAVNRVAWSADGRRLVSAGRDGSHRFWDGEFGHELFTLRDLVDAGIAVAWSHDGRSLAAAGPSGRIWLIDLGHPR